VWIPLLRLRGITVLSDGVTVNECTTDQQALDRGRQGDFGIAIGQVWTDVQATPTASPPGPQRGGRGSRATAVEGGQLMAH
jgi:hypothetical protein